jgi:hypothetical protein
MPGEEKELEQLSLLDYIYYKIKLAKKLTVKDLYAQNVDFFSGHQYTENDTQQILTQMVEKGVLLKNEKLEYFDSPMNTGFFGFGNRYYSEQKKDTFKARLENAWKILPIVISFLACFVAAFKVIHDITSKKNEPFDKNIKAANPLNNDTGRQQLYDTLVVLRR